MAYITVVSIVGMHGLRSLIRPGRSSEVVIKWIGVFKNIVHSTFFEAILLDPVVIQGCIALYRFIAKKNSTKLYLKQPSTHLGQCF